MREGEYRQLYLNVCLASPADRREEGKKMRRRRRKGGSERGEVHEGMERKEKTQESEGEKDYFW